MSCARFIAAEVSHESVMEMKAIVAIVVVGLKQSWRAWER